MIKENTPTLETERLILRKFLVRDVSDMLPIYSDEEVNEFLPWHPLKTIEQAQEYLVNKILPQYEKEIAYSYAIELKETNHVIGYVHIDDIGGANDIGYGISRENWNKGFVTEASKKIVNHLEEVGFPYITATHDINNPNSGEVMKKIGMSYKYTYKELWQPKNFLVTFRMYQLNLDGNDERVFNKYWVNSTNHYVEDLGCITNG